MKYSLPQNIANLEPYAPLEGEYRIRLDANESFLPLMPKWQDAFQEVVSTIEYHRYPDPNATELCKKAANYFGVRAECVTAFDGSDELLALLSGTFYQDGKRLAVFEQDFSMYHIYAKTYGVECLMIPKRADLTIDVDETLAFIERNHISALLFSNPCNPTSVGLLRDDVIRLVRSTDALILLDEAYMDFWNQSLLDCVEDFDNLIILKTCSKAVGMAGIRLGFAVTNPHYTKVLRAVKSPYNVNTISQAFGALVLSDTDYLNRATAKLVKEREKLQEALVMLQTKYPIIQTVYPSCTNFVYLDVIKAQEIYDLLLKNSIAIRKMGESLRITTGSFEENKEFLAVLETILKSLM